MTRIAVIGHVEWVARRRARASRSSAARSCSSTTRSRSPAAAAAWLRARCRRSAPRRASITALGDDAAAAAAERVLQSDGCELRVARRAGPQNRVTTVSDPDGERTIFVHGPNAHPTLDDPLDWDELAGFDGVFYTGDDPRTRGRRAPGEGARGHRPAARERGRERRAGRRPGRLGERPRRALRRGGSARAAAAVRLDRGRRRRHYLRRRRQRPAAGRRSRRPARSSTPTARATSSWRR